MWACKTTDAFPLEPLESARDNDASHQEKHSEFWGNAPENHLLDGLMAPLLSQSLSAHPQAK